VVARHARRAGDDASYEAKFYNNAQLVVEERLPSRERAIRWAERQRASMERP
jgi:hypothetical protein